MGVPTLFIRFNKCNIICKFCDTEFNNSYDGNVFTKIRKILEKYPVKQLCFTGGEPLLFKDQIKEIIYFVLELGIIKSQLTIKIETNGTIPLYLGMYPIFTKTKIIYTITPKLMFKNLYAKDELIRSWHETNSIIVFKFMIPTDEELFVVEMNNIREFIDIYKLNNFPIYFSPINDNDMGHDTKYLLENYNKLLTLVYKYEHHPLIKKINLDGISLQLHKILKLK